jgi:putative hydrolase of the HAD superfamily
VLTQLAPRYELAIISNFDGRLRVILDQMELARFFCPMVISSEVGADKPDPWIFTEALRLAGVSANEALHVGDDRLADYQGAMRAGMNAFHLDRPRLSLRHLPAPEFTGNTSGQR